MPPERRIVLRPLATPLPLGFIGLAVATAVLSAGQLGWFSPARGHAAALVALVFATPMQALASVFGFLSRDPIAGTGMGVLAGTWAVIGAVTLAAPVDVTTPGLGVALLAAAVALLVPATAGAVNAVAASVMALAALRFAATGVAELTGSASWVTVAGALGIALALLALYAALAYELESAHRRAVLPVLRRGPAAEATHADIDRQVADVTHEAGVRKQL